MLIPGWGVGRWGGDEEKWGGEEDGRTSDASTQLHFIQHSLAHVLSFSFLSFFFFLSHCFAACCFHCYDVFLPFGLTRIYTIFCGLKCQELVKADFVGTSDLFLSC